MMDKAAQIMTVLSFRECCVMWREERLIVLSAKIFPERFAITLIRDTFWKAIFLSFTLDLSR